MLAHRPRRWSNIKPALLQRLLFAKHTVVVTYTLSEEIDIFNLSDSPVQGYKQTCWINNLLWSYYQCQLTWESLCKHWLQRSMWKQDHLTPWNSPILTPTLHAPYSKCDYFWLFSAKNTIGLYLSSPDHFFVMYDHWSKSFGGRYNVKYGDIGIQKGFVWTK